MIAFACDYAEGAHESIIEVITKTNMEQTVGYGEDFYCEEARASIKNACDNRNADIHFLVGGTQANLTVISAMLRPHQGVMTASCGHIAVHETGAIEATGHKVLEIPSRDGKITAKQIKEVYENHRNDATHEHMVQPKLVYLSSPTEYGMIYQLKELQEIRQVCDDCGLFLYLDGARLAYGLTASGNDVTLPELAKICDIFYIGGTKCGALFGEAVIITKEALKEDFRYLIKQRGGMFAKGRLLGIQFLQLFTDDLYFKLGNHANRLAEKLKKSFIEQGIELYTDSPTNQQFVIMDENMLSKLSKKYTYSYIAPLEQEKAVVRFCTSWATTEENVEELISDIRELLS